MVAEAPLHNRDVDVDQPELQDRSTGRSGCLSGEREYDGGVERTECALLQADGARCCCVTSNLVGGRARRAMLLLLATLNEGMQTVWNESNAERRNAE